MSYYTNPIFTNPIFTNSVFTSSVLSPYSSTYYTTSVIPTETVLISSDVIFPNPFEPIKPTIINFDYSHPLISSYETIDNNLELRQRMLKYIYDLVRDKWLLDEINSILNYYTYSNGEVKLISNMSDYSKSNISKDTNEIAEKKVKYITKTILDKFAMEHILNKFTKYTNTKWVNLVKNEYYLMKFIKEYIVKKITKLLKNKK